MIFQYCFQWENDKDLISETMVLGNEPARSDFGTSTFDIVAVLSSYGKLLEG